jgi:uncharacterized iron-regulated membrane protein
MNTLKSLIKTGFGLSIGVFVAQMIFMIIGVVFFIPGFMMWNTESKKFVKDTARQTGAIVLMAFGVIIMGGVGFGILMNSVSEFDF